MHYKVHEISEERASVLDEHDQTVVECGSKVQAQLVAGALGLRDRMLTQLAHGFVEALDNGESSASMAQQWRGVVMSNALSEDDADELWAIVRKILDNAKGPGQ